MNIWEFKLAYPTVKLWVKTWTVWTHRSAKCLFSHLSVCETGEQNCPPLNHCNLLVILMFEQWDLVRTRHFCSLITWFTKTCCQDRLILVHFGQGKPVAKTCSHTWLASFSIFCFTMFGKLSISLPEHKINTVNIYDWVFSWQRYFARNPFCPVICTVIFPRG